MIRILLSPVDARRSEESGDQCKLAKAIAVTALGEAEGGRDDVTELRAVVLPTVVEDGLTFGFWTITYLPAIATPTTIAALIKAKPGLIDIDVLNRGWASTLRSLHDPLIARSSCPNASWRRRH
jgi:hypothetical protein